MNYGKEIDRVSFEVVNYDSDTMQIGYQIGNTLFYVELTWWRTLLNHETNMRDIDVNLERGEWWIEEDDVIGESKPLEFGDGYYTWILGMLDYLITEHHFLYDYLVEEDDDFNHWEDYGI